MLDTLGPIIKKSFYFFEKASRFTINFLRSCQTQNALQLSMFFFLLFSASCAR